MAPRNTRKKKLNVPPGQSVKENDLITAQEEVLPKEKTPKE